MTAARPTHRLELRIYNSSTVLSFDLSIGYRFRTVWTDLSRLPDPSISVRRLPTAPIHQLSRVPDSL